ncbi:MAG: UPF0182 family protein [Acidimicrobiales bacterium]
MTPVDEAPVEVRDHFRYPIDLFKVQTEMLGTYHVEDPVQFLQDDLSWRVASEPLRQAEAGTTTTAQGLMEPQYRLTSLPGGEDIEYVVQRVRPEFGRRGELEPTGADGCAGRPLRRSERRQARALRAAAQHRCGARPGRHRHSQVSACLEYITPLDLQGSKVQWGEMQLVMVENTIVYIRPLYVAGAGGTNNVPELAQIVAVSGDRIGMSPTLSGALAKVTRGRRRRRPTPPATPTPRRGASSTLRPTSMG